MVRRFFSLASGYALQYRLHFMPFGHSFSAARPLLSLSLARPLPSVVFAAPFLSLARPLPSVVFGALRGV
jgi:hypothetical protein